MLYVVARGTQGLHRIYCIAPAVASVFRMVAVLRWLAASDALTTVPFVHFPPTNRIDSRNEHTKRRTRLTMRSGRNGFRGVFCLVGSPSCFVDLLDMQSGYTARISACHRRGIMRACASHSGKHSPIMHSRISPGRSLPTICWTYLFRIKWFQCSAIDLDVMILISS